MTLPTDDKARKALPLYDFMFGYFPDAWLEVVKVAVAGNDQHNPGEPLHWARGKSMDQMNTAFRHIFDYGTGVPVDEKDGCHHLAKAIWRLMARLQLDLEGAAQKGDSGAAYEAVFPDLCTDCGRPMADHKPNRFIAKLNCPSK